MVEKPRDEKGSEVEIYQYILRQRRCSGSRVSSSDRGSFLSDLAHHQPIHPTRKQIPLCTSSLPPPPSSNDSLPSHYPRQTWRDPHVMVKPSSHVNIAMPAKNLLPACLSTKKVGMKERHTTTTTITTNNHQHHHQKPVPRLPPPLPAPALATFVFASTALSAYCTSRFPQCQCGAICLPPKPNQHMPNLCSPQHGKVHTLTVRSPHLSKLSGQMLPSSVCLFVDVESIEGGYPHSYNSPRVRSRSQRAIPTCISQNSTIHHNCPDMNHIS